MNIFNTFKRAPVRGALFICLLFIVSMAKGADSGPQFRVKKVVDGDTIVLKNGDTVRFLGVNTPELGHGRFKDEPLANQARMYVSRRIEGREVRLEMERPELDRYGRRLAQIFTVDGSNVQRGLLERGLAFVVAVGEPPFDYVDEYVEAEKRAREQSEGVWGLDFYAPVSAKKAVDMRHRGYTRVLGTVKRVSRSRNYQTLHLEGDFRVLIPHSNWSDYFRENAGRYVGKLLEARGWIFKTHGVTGMKIYHPAMLVEDSK